MPDYIKRETVMAECFFCHRNGAADPLDRHHIFGGTNRYKSERFGLFVYLCHSSCHIFGADSIHGGWTEEAERRRRELHRYGQRKWMEDTNSTEQDFIKIFGRNYL